MARQRLVGSDPLWLQAVIEEQTLDRLVGGVGVMAEQLRHLCDLMDRDNVDLRIMPTSTAGHAGPDGDDPANDPAAQPVIALPASVWPAFLAAACANAPHAIADAPAIIHHSTARSLSPGPAFPALHRRRMGRLRRRRA
ncbi:hypothetical protein GV790_14105 [Nocardia cyriacigeorgica]|nr:hypothetical protein [Nocardia cyriacigeorgica]